MTTSSSRWDDYLDVFLAPSELFARRSDGKFGQALLVLMVLMTIAWFGTKTAMQPVMDAEISRGLAEARASNPSLTEDQIAGMRKFGETFAAVFLLGGTPIVILVLGAAVWGAGRIVGAGLNYAQGATIITFAMFPRLIESAVNALQALLLDERAMTSRYSVSLGVGRFLDPDTAGTLSLALLGRVDLFTLWVTALVAIGIKAMGKVGMAEAAGAAAMVWVIGALPAVVGALRAG
jgi:hypothetical protein